MKLTWSDRARRDLLSIATYIARDNRDAPRRWVDRLRGQARRAAKHPQSGRVVPEFGREDIREILVGNYRIVYRTTDDSIQVLTVFEGHRTMPTVDADK